MQLRKYHGNGNDFLIRVDFDGAHPIDARTARALCDRHRGIGADGLIRAVGGRDGADVSMELFNADGGRAEISGNGLRCLAWALIDAGVVDGPVVTVGTDAGLRRAVVDRDLGSVAAGMGRPIVKEGEVDEGAGVAQAAFVDVGNPHIVWLVDSPADLSRPEIVERARQRSEAALDPVNVEVAAADGDGVFVSRVWERGVGETLSCGSGAVAVAAAARQWGLAGDRVTVGQPGGRLTVEFGSDGAVLSGPVEFVFEVEVAGSWR